MKVRVLAALSFGGAAACSFLTSFDDLTGGPPEAGSFPAADAAADAADARARSWCETQGDALACLDFDDPSEIDSWQTDLSRGTLDIERDGASTSPPGSLASRVIGPDAS